MSGYKYFLETNTSSSQRIEEDRITYLNKGSVSYHHGFAEIRLFKTRRQT